ncbi:MAG: PrsW family intramembrane metalloprotease [Lachnospiraceae bacterium]|nr:PrsW family intramembrane metalloprotease [Lachnospiraceae bacterium]MDO4409582.1 PrsW family intramembrane metalloprotease [Eubacteriales bacterium]
MSIILVAALLPPLYLLWKVYQIDAIEKEPPGLLLRIFVLGMFSTIPAVVLETIGQGVLEMVLGLSGGRLFNFLMYFIVVAGAEEIVKYFAMKLPTWRSEEFNFVFDGVVYGVTASLGFAALENVLYVIEGGLATAGVRALTSIPIHAICGVYMGHYYGIAKSAEVYGASDICAKMKRRALLIPMLIHGAYDFIVSDESELLILLFFAYVILTDFFALRAVKKYAGNDVRMF